MNRINTKLFALALLALCFLLTACPPANKDDNADEPDAGEQEQPPIPVEVHKIKRGDIDQTLQSSATVTARQEVLLLAETTGKVTRVMVEEGDTVQPKQELARLSNLQLEQSIGGSEITVSRLRKEREDLKPLLEKGYTSRRSFEEIEYQLKQAQQQLRAARGQLQSLRVVSPISGLVARRSIQQGQQVTPGVELFHLVNPEQLEVVLNIPERSLGQVREGGEGYVVSEALGQTLHFPARVRLINPVVDPRAGTIKVTLEVLKPELQADGKTWRLRPGMLVQSHLITARQKDVVLVPKRALMRDGNNTHVFVAKVSPEGHVAEKRQVKRGLTQGNLVEIGEGVKAGEDLVVLGQNGLKEGSKIKLVQP